MIISAVDPSATWVGPHHRTRKNKIFIQAQDIKIAFRLPVILEEILRVHYTLHRVLRRSRPEGTRMRRFRLSTAAVLAASVLAVSAPALAQSSTSNSRFEISSEKSHEGDQGPRHPDRQRQGQLHRRLGRRRLDQGQGPPDKIAGHVGDDTLYGAGGRDTIWGHPGDDKIYGGAGADLLQGHVGNDQIWGDGGDDTIDGGEGDDLLYGGLGNDQISSQAGNDHIWGDAGDDTVNAGPGNDIIYGGDDRDTINGSDGDDVIFGGPGGDNLPDRSGNVGPRGGRGPRRAPGSPGHRPSLWRGRQRSSLRPRR